MTTPSPSHSARFVRVSKTGWSRHGESVVVGREGAPEPLSAWLAEWKGNLWRPVPPEEKWYANRYYTGERRWLFGSPEVDEQSLTVWGSTPDKDPHGQARAPIEIHPTPGWTAPSEAFVDTVPRKLDEMRRRLQTTFHGTPFYTFQDHLRSVVATGLYPTEIVGLLINLILNEGRAHVEGDSTDLLDRKCRSVVYFTRGARRELLLDSEIDRYAGQADYNSEDRRDDEVGSCEVAFTDFTSELEE